MDIKMVRYIKTIQTYKQQNSTQSNALWTSKL